MSSPSRYHTCPMCGLEFEKVDTLCAHGCPFGSMCNLIRCPNCKYEFPDKPQTFSWLRRLFRWKKPESAMKRRDLFTLGQMKAGERARVVAVNSAQPHRRNTLAVFGLVPGSEVTLQQQRPSCVVKIGETDLALDADIAREVLVKPMETASGIAP